MDKNNVIELERRVFIGTDPLTELLKEGARKLLAQAVESEVARTAGTVCRASHR